CEREPAREARLPCHETEADGSEQKPRSTVGKAGERRFEPRDAEHPEQKAAEDAGDAVIEHLRHPRRNHEQADGERFLRLRRDAERQQPERRRSRRESCEQRCGPQVGSRCRGRDGRSLRARVNRRINLHLCVAAVLVCARAGTRPAPTGVRCPYATADGATNRPSRIACTVGKTSTILGSWLTMIT